MWPFCYHQALTDQYNPVQSSCVCSNYQSEYRLPFFPYDNKDIDCTITRLNQIEMLFISSRIAEIVGYSKQAHEKNYCGNGFVKVFFEYTYTSKLQKSSGGTWS